jgi:hypothetical protein
MAVFILAKAALLLAPSTINLALAWFKAVNVTVVPCKTIANRVGVGRAWAQGRYMVSAYELHYPFPH